MNTQRRTRFGVGAIAVVVVAALLPLAGAGAAGPNDAGLFAPVAEGRALDVTASHIARQRNVTVDTGSLFQADGKPQGKGALGDLTFNLFADVTYTGKVRNIDRDQWGTSWTGDLVGVDDGYFYMVTVDDAFAAHFASSEGVYEVHYNGDGTHRVLEIDQSAYVDHPPGYEYDAPASLDLISDQELADLGDLADSGDRQDVIVLFTNEAKTLQGGLSSMKALIALAMTETNASYAQSGVNTRLRLLAIEETSYLESSFGGALTDLANGTGVLSRAHDLRNTFGADMVAMIIDDGQYCGLAAGILPGAASAFHITARTCATGYYSFGHEFGHLQGAHHDEYVANNTVYSYGHGWVNLPNRWRTIMAYNSECSATSPFTSCVRLQWWSNPSVNYPDLADPMGGTNAKNYMVLNDSATTVANWRTEKIGDEFISRFNNHANGWKKVNGSWSKNARGYYTSKGKANTNVSARHTDKYGNLTYEVKMKRKGDGNDPNWIVIRGNHGNLDADNRWYPAYYFQYRTNGDYSVLKIKPNGSVVELVPWTADAAIRTGAKWNKLKVVANGDKLKFYINGTLVANITDDQLETGTVGFGFYGGHNDGSQRLSVDYAKLWNTPTADENPNG